MDCAPNGGSAWHQRSVASLGPNRSCPRLVRLLGSILRLGHPPHAACLSRARRYARAGEHVRTTCRAGCVGDGVRAAAAVRLCHHALVGGADGGAQRHDARPGGAGEAVPGLLVSPLRLRAAARAFGGGRAGPDAGVLRAGARTPLAGPRRPGQGPVPHLPADGDGAVPGQRMGQGARPQTGRGPDGTSRSSSIRRRRATGSSRRTPARRSRPSNTVGR